MAREQVLDLQGRRWLVLPDDPAWDSVRELRRLGFRFIVLTVEALMGRASPRPEPRKGMAPEVLIRWVRAADCWEVLNDRP